MSAATHPALAILSHPRTQSRVNLLAFTMLAALTALLLLFPDLAFAQDAAGKVSATAKKAYDLVFSVVYYLCAIAVIVSGLAATFGRMEWGQFGKIVAGIVVVFSATAMVDYFK